MKIYAPGAIGGVVLCGLVCVGIAGAPPGARAQAEGLDARALMERVDRRPRGRDEMLRATWRLLDSRGGERVRETRSYWLDRRGSADGIRARRLIFFDAPATVKDTAFLVWSSERADEDDGRWIYLPALRQVRRIAGGDRANSFMGISMV